MHRAFAELAEPATERKPTCSGVWGGIQDMDADVTAGHVTAAIYSSPCDGGDGGDIVYFGVCKGEVLTRMAIADVVGHGQAVSQVSRTLYDSLEAHMCDPDSSVILSEVNTAASRQGLKAMTTAAVVAHHAGRGEFRVSRAGHPPALLKRASERTWSVVADDRDRNTSGGPVTGLPLAVEPGARYSQQVVPASVGDRLFVYTDGVTEAPSPQGELFGVERLKDVLDANANRPLSELKSAVLQALGEHTGNSLTHDDVTLVVMESH